MGAAETSCGPDCGVASVILHALANSVTAVLINARVLEWKLPPYSRLERPVREIERHAQRSHALLTRLLRYCEMNPSSGRKEQDSQESCAPVPCLRGTEAAVMAQGRQARDAKTANWPSLAPSPSVPASASSPQPELTSLCDGCTIAVFPKAEESL